MQAMMQAPYENAKQGTYHRLPEDNFTTAWRHRTAVPHPHARKAGD